MRVDVAHVANEQLAGTGDLISLLGGDENSSFALLLNLGGNTPHAADGVDGSREKQGIRSKEKQSDQRQAPALGHPEPGVTLDPAGMQILPSVGGAPWRLESGDFGAAETIKDELSVQLAAEEASGKPSLRTPAAIDVRTVGAPVTNREPAHDENAAEKTPTGNLSDPERTEPSKIATAKNQGPIATRAIAAPDDQDRVPAVMQSSSATREVVQPSGGLGDNGVAVPIPQGEATPMLAGISAVQRYSAALSHGVTSDGQRQDPAISMGGRWSGVPAESGGGQVRSSTPMQGVVDTASSSTAGGRGQGGGTDTHRSPIDTKEVAADGHVPPPQIPQSSSVEALSTSSSVHEHSVLMNSNHPESTRESSPGAQLNELASPRTEDVSARLLGSAMRGDLRVGVHTEVFGRVTIQTNAQGGQLSAQLSLENPKESATLAAHLPGVEQRIVQQHGLNASVRLVSGFDGGAGGGSMGRDQSGAGRREPERYHSDIAGQPGDIERDFSNEGRGVETVLLGSQYLGSSRLDVTV